MVPGGMRAIANRGRPALWPKAPIEIAYAPETIPMEIHWGVLYVHDAIVWAVPARAPRVLAPLSGLGSAAVSLNRSVAVAPDGTDAGVNLQGIRGRGYPYGGQSKKRET